MNMVRRGNLEKWADTILKDEFDDISQNKKGGYLADGETVTGEHEMDLLRFMGFTDTPVLDVGCGGGVVKADYLLDPCPSRAKNNKKIRTGWMENMPFRNGELGTILCWSTFTFLRSPIEALMECNRCLKMDGCLIFDVVMYSTMPLCQTVNYESFLRHLPLHGFQVQGWMMFGTEWHQRLGIRCHKEREWDPSYFRMPQAEGKIRNYLPERDWFLG